MCSSDLLKGNKSENGTTKKQRLKCLKEGCINEENRTEGHGFTSGVSPKKTDMLGEQIIAGQLTNHERITILL